MSLIGDSSASPELNLQVARTLDALREDICDEVAQRLRAVESGIATDPLVWRLCAENIHSTIDELIVDLTGARGTALGDRLSRMIGEVRAEQGIHPDQSVRASLVLFEVASDRFLNAMNGESLDLESAALVLTRLHRIIMEHVFTYILAFGGRLFTTIQEAHLAERRRLSRDLHDRVASGAGAILRNLELCEAHHASSSDAVNARVHAANRAFDEVFGALTEIGDRLRVTAPQTSLYAALRSYFDSIETSTCRVWITVDGDDMRISEELSTELFLILREALGNALHHAGTDAVELDITIDRERVVCRVTDRGIGFDPEQERISGHTGLLSMRERAQSVNGDFAIRSSPGRGTEILVVAPLDPRAPTTWKCAVELLD